ncbi:MAG TPA: amidohydrolase family protein [Gemmatimonadaceae bacterium]|nr:amidohydrolase family protein [Gemmatimonadaceae bacterium]
MTRYVQFTRLAAAGLLAVASSSGAQQPTAAAQPAQTGSGALDPLALPAPPAGTLVAITNATIMTASRGTITNGTILIRDGKIAAVGTDVQVPAGAKVIDGRGKWVTPGIIDAHSHTANEAINEGSQSVTAEVRMDDVLRQDGISLYRQLAGGTTTVNILHGSANAIGGQNAVVKLRFGLPVDSLRFQGAPPGIKFALGENVRQTRNPNSTRYPHTRQGVEDVYREAFTRAKEYQREWAAYNTAKAAFDRQRNRNAASAPIPPRKDLELDALVEILEGKRLVHWHSYRADEILMALGIAKEFGFKVASFQHVLEGYKIADELAAAGAGASTFADMWGYKMEAWDAIPHNAALMAERGVLVTINSDSDERARRLYQEAAKAIRFGGASEETALRMITLNAAIQLGVQDRVGSIDVGKDADIAIFNGHPFAPASRVDMTLIDGRVFFDRATAPTLEWLIQMMRNRPRVTSDDGGVR